jgi:hypothetical protein
MGQITKTDILNVYNELGIKHSSTKIKDGDFDSSEYTLFLISNSNILIYFTNFTVIDANDNSCYTISGDMFFITPTGSIFSDWVKLEESYIIKSDMREAFIVKHEKDDIDYMDIDKSIIKIMTDHKLVNETVAYSNLSNFIKLDIEIL